MKTKLEAEDTLLTTYLHLSLKLWRSAGEVEQINHKLRNQIAEGKIAEKRNKD